MKAHTKVCGTDQIIPRTRPLRIAAKRQREMMVIITNDTVEDTEWIDEEFLDASGKVQCLL